MSQAILALGARWWPLQMARELDDAILTLRTNHLELGTWLLKTRGRIDPCSRSMRRSRCTHPHWFVRECAA
jgi:benzoyl-CoA-dihydrodiol lyase